MINLENFKAQNPNEISKKLNLKKATKVMLDQETDNTETSNQIDISVAISFKQQDKAKKKNKSRIEETSPN